MFNKIIKKIFDRFYSLFKDNPNSLSMMRYITWSTCTSIVLTWVIMSFMKGQILDIPTGVVMLFAVAVIGKASQKIVEGYYSKSTDYTIPVTTDEQNDYKMK